MAQANPNLEGGGHSSSYKEWIPAGTVIVALVLLGNVIPKFVTYFLILILILLVVNKWDRIKGIFS